MIKFLKNFKVYSCWKTIIYFLAPLIFLFLFLPLPALAGLGEWIRDAFYSVIFFIPTLFFLLLLKLSEGIAFLMGILLDWVISPAFVKQSYTRPCPPPSFAPANEADTCNQIIGLGLNITQSFVNLLLVAILVYIAFSIALRIGEHDAKKLFAKLIIVALLVNFVPVFLGVILDAANIIMNFFLQPIQGGTSGVLFQSSSTTSLVWSAVSAAGTGFRDRVGLLAAGSAAIFLNLGIALAFLLFAGLFMLRYIFIWVLVILAPIAFVFWILPSTKKYWDMWWGQLIQWAFIGIPIAFFLYLGMASFAAITATFKAQISGPLPSHEVGLISRMFPYYVVLTFLFLGFLAALQISAVGTSGIVGLVKKAPGKAAAAGKWTAKAGVGAARGIPAVSRAEESIRRRLEGSRIGRLVGGPGAQERERKVRMDAAKKWVERTPDTPQGNQDLTRIIQRRALTDEERYRRASAIETLAKRKALDLTSADAARFLPEAQRHGADISAIYKARPDFAPHLIDPHTATPLTTQGVMDRIEPSDFWKGVQAEAFQNPDVVLQASLDAQKFEYMTRRMRRREKQAFQAGIAALSPAQAGQVPIGVLNDLATDARWQV